MVLEDPQPTRSRAGAQGQKEHPLFRVLGADAGTPHQGANR